MNPEPMGSARSAPTGRGKGSVDRAGKQRNAIWNLISRDNALDLLRAIADEDPLGIRPRVARRLAARGLLLDADAVVRKAWAFVAWRAESKSLRTDPGRWVRRQVEAAIDAVWSERRSADPWLGALEKTLSLEPGRLEATLRRFHAMEESSRLRVLDRLGERGPAEQGSLGAAPEWRALRLLKLEASAPRAGSTATSMAAVEVEFDGVRRRARSSALQALLRHYVVAAAPARSFLMLEKPAVPATEAWSVLRRLGEQRFSKAPGHVEPGEPALSVARRVLAAAMSERQVEDASNEAEDPLCLWAARIRWIESGPRAGVEALEAIRGRVEIHPARAQWTADLIAAWLDCGAPKRARGLIGPIAGPGSATGRGALAQLSVWCLLLCGAEELARAKAREFSELLRRRPWSRLPRSLGELRLARPDWADLLAAGAEIPGDVWSAGRGWDSDRAPAGLERGALGAVLIGAFALNFEGLPVWVGGSVAPGKAGSLERWLAEAPPRVPSPPELELMRTEEIVVEHREAGIDALLGGESVLALALVPVRSSENGALVGWVRVECEHYLLPDFERLAALETVWRGRIVERAAEAPSHGCVVEPRMTAIPPRPCPEAAALMERWVRKCRLRLRRRRFWLFVRDDSGTRCAADGGLGLTRLKKPSASEATRRAMATGTEVRFGTPNPALSVHPRAASGVAFPILCATRVVAVLVIESERRCDDAAIDATRASELQSLAPQLVCAVFRAWHIRNFGKDVSFDLGAGSFGVRALRTFLQWPRERTLWIVGPAGCGKRVLVRWAHALGGGNASSLVQVGSNWVPADEGEPFELADGVETVAFRRVERLGVVQRRRLRERSATVVGTGTACVLTSTDAPSAEDSPEVVLRVPPLRRRRNAIPDLVRIIGAELGREFSDEQLAWFWRQSWPGELKQLCEFASTAPRDAGCAGLTRAARREGWEPRLRLPSRTTGCRDLAAALRWTRKANGRANRTRAALYLGWNRDTVAAHLERSLDALRRS